MSIIISGICGFAGSTLARCLLESKPNLKIFGFDNLSRRGSYLNQTPLEELDIKIFHADARQQSDIDNLPPADWIIDAAANPSVLAGLDGLSSARQTIEHNLFGTVNLLEYARKHQAGFMLLSTSRVYSIAALQEVPLEVVDEGFSVVPKAPSQPGLSLAGVTEEFSTAAPISLYGGTKLSSEILALEYAEMYKIPVWINRCGVLAGAGQFGRPDQGIFAYWVNAYLRRQKLRYIGFGGSGHQMRDCLHPRDLANLLETQMKNSDLKKPKICNIGGGADNSMSLKQLSNWCQERFGKHDVSSEAANRQLDVPWLIMDSGLAERTWDFQVTTKLPAILSEIADHAEHHPEWLKISAV